MTPFAFFRIYSHSILWTPDPGECTLSAEVFEARRTYQAAVTKEGGTGARVRGGPIGLVVVLAVLTEVCLLQAASMRRKVQAVLPPPEDSEEEGR
jgi:hypothetical protein